MEDYTEYKTKALEDMYKWVRELRNLWMFKGSKDPQLAESIKTIVDCADNAYAAWFIVGIMVSKYRAQRAYNKAIAKYKQQADKSYLKI